MSMPYSSVIGHILLDIPLQYQGLNLVVTGYYFFQSLHQQNSDTNNENESVDSDEEF